MIQDIYEQFLDEVCGAKEYVRCAMMHRDDRDMSNTYLEMSKNEIEHAQKLMNFAKKMNIEGEYDILVSIMDRQLFEAKASVNAFD